MNFNSIFEELNKLYEEERVEKPEQAEDEVKEEPVEESCAKESLKEAADDEIEIVDDEEIEVEEPIEPGEGEEKIPEESVDTVKDFAKSLEEYDGKLKLEFKPIVVDGKEYPITGIMWDDTEEGKLVAEVIFNMPEEEPIEEEIPEEDAVAENLKGEVLSEEDEDLDEFLNANIKVDARGFGGSGNNVDVI